MESSFALEIFVDKKYAENFLCIICQLVPVGSNLSDHGKCGTVFCHACISQWLKTKTTCPKCRESFGNLEFAKNSNRTMYNFLQNMKVKCPWNQACDWVGDYSDLEKHMKVEKEKTRIVECPYKHIGCTEKGAKGLIEKHLAEQAWDHAEKNAAFIEKQKKEYEENLAKSKAMVSSKPLPPLSSANPVVYLTISINDSQCFNLIFDLQVLIVPKTVENFRMLCLGVRKRSEERVLHYKGSLIHRIIPSFIFQGGDLVNGNGTGSLSIYGVTFPDENFNLKHDDAGVLSMANIGPNTNGCQFFVTLKACPWLDGKNVVFGRMVEGKEALAAIASFGTSTGQPANGAKIQIIDSGQIY